MCNASERVRTIDKMNEKIETETQEINKKLLTMKERVTAVVDTRVDIAIKTTREKVDKSYAEAGAVQPRNVGATYKSHSREPPDLDHDIKKSIRIQGMGFQKTPTNPKPRILSPIRMK